MPTKKPAKKKAEPVEKTLPISGFKGFDKNLQCQGFQYKIGEESAMPKGRKLVCCPDNPETEGGLHFCENGLDVLGYYNPADSRFAAVESRGETEKQTDDSKVATSRLFIKAEITLSHLIGAGVKFILDRVNWKDAKETNTGYQSAATNTGDQSAATNTGYRSAATNTGDQSAATNTGDRSAATNTGDRSAATNTGDRSAATNTGYRSAATNTGYRSAATNTGDRSAATNTGDRSAATNTGYRSAATNTGDQSAATNTGDRSAATNTGDRSAANVEGKESIAIATGYEGKAAGKKGCWIVLAEWEERKDGYHIIDVRTFPVDGVDIKEDVYYRLCKGAAIEA